jgi:chemotaxis protein MotB
MARPVIIVKKTKGHGGHHGGAWKVAYADFVTAMMAFFMVMWLMNSSTNIREAVAGYFNDPHGAAGKTGSAAAGSGETLALARNDLDRLREEIESAMKEIPEFQKLKNQVEMTVTGEGLRIELIETETGMFFETGSAHPSKSGEEMLAVLARELGQIPNDIVIEGHTDARPFAARTEYTNWELSSDRANSARRLMEDRGLRAGQLRQVRGFADRSLRNPADPGAAANRRISVIVRYGSQG